MPVLFVLLYLRRSYFKENCIIHAGRFIKNKTHGIRDIILKVYIPLKFRCPYCKVGATSFLLIPSSHAYCYGWLSTIVFKTIGIFQKCPNCVNPIQIRPDAKRKSVLFCITAFLFHFPYNWTLYVYNPSGATLAPLSVLRKPCFHGNRLNK
jgi:hypothetical protein